MLQMEQMVLQLQMEPDEEPDEPEEPEESELLVKPTGPVEMKPVDYLEPVEQVMALGTLGLSSNPRCSSLGCQTL